MSRTEEDIASRVDIAIMRDTTLRAYPTSYSEVCDTFRPRLACTRRTDSGRKRFIYFLVPSPVRSRFVAEHASEGRPPRIQYRLRQAGLGKSGGIHVADRDVIEFANNAGRELVVKIAARIDDTRVDMSRLTPFAGPLRLGKAAGQLSQMMRVVDLLSVGQSSKVFNTQVNANAAVHQPRRCLRDFNNDVQEPMAARLAGEVRSVLNLALRKRPRIEHSKGPSRKAKGVSLTLKMASFQRHPAQRAFAAPSQERAILLSAGLGVLFANGIDRACV
jgi:hypothetical protein